MATDLPPDVRDRAAQAALDPYRQMKDMTPEQLRTARTLIRDDQANAPFSARGGLSWMLGQVEAELADRRRVEKPDVR